MRVLVVGAGVAGLVCGRTLHRAGVDVEIIEASDGVGGRVRSDVADGFVLDRGFQVLFTAYPAAKRQLDYARLDLKKFDPGAVVSRAARREILSDPIRDPSSLAASLAAGSVTLSDKVLAARLAVDLLQAEVTPGCRAEADETVDCYLHRYGFSERFVENFARPFFGGILLNDTLDTSATAFLFDYKMLATGDTVVPARGMGQISEQMAEDLYAAGRVRLQTAAASLVYDASGETCAGVRITGGETLLADRIVIATPAPEAGRLIGEPMPEGCVGTTQFYFAGTEPLHAGKKILLHSNAGAYIRNGIQVSNVAPGYAPDGRYLFSAVALGVTNEDDETLNARALRDLKRIFAGDKRALSALRTFEPLAIYRIPYGQFAQPPGIYGHLPESKSALSGVYFAGEFTEASSINGAIVSGEKAASAILAEAVE